MSLQEIKYCPLPSNRQTCTTIVADSEGKRDKSEGKKVADSVSIWMRLVRFCMSAKLTQLLMKTKHKKGKKQKGLLLARDRKLPHYRWVTNVTGEHARDGCQSTQHHKDHKINSGPAAAGQSWTHDDQWWAMMDGLYLQVLGVVNSDTTRSDDSYTGLVWIPSLCTSHTNQVPDLLRLNKTFAYCHIAVNQLVRAGVFN